MEVLLKIHIGLIAFGIGERSFEGDIIPQLARVLETFWICIQSCLHLKFIVS